jgi:hypothetical protein
MSKFNSKKSDTFTWSTNQSEITACVLLKESAKDF